MKKSILVICSSVLFLAGCEEKAPLINFTESVGVKETTTVSSTVPATDPHNVLIEEFTGQSCSNCPSAHNTLEGYVANNPPGRINVIGMYKFNFSQTVPPNNAIYDLRDSVATNIADAVYLGVGALPSAGIDRTPVAGSILLTSGSWGGTKDNRLTVVDSLNLNLTSAWDAANQLVTIVATITYTKTVATPHNLSIVIVEDSIIDKQEYPPFDPQFPSGEDEAYVFTNVFRDMVSVAPWGDPILSSMPVKEPGRVVQRVYTYKLKSKTPAIKPEHCRVIAFVNSTNGTNLQIMQSTQTKMKP